MPATKQATAVGIDGCRGGWIAAIFNPDGSIEWLLEKKIADIIGRLPTESTVLVDMIIGLPDAKQPFRECDRLARKILSPHGSRVFPAPPREALAADNYPEACKLARAATGKAISKQCWHLFPKIHELDVMDDPRVRESHPELVFARFKGGMPIAASKKSPEGEAARLHCLNQHLKGAAAGYTDVLRRYRRKVLARDDAIDALALCLAAAHPDALTALRADSDAPAIWY